MISNNDIKNFALSAGADIVGIGKMSDFEGTAPEKDPRFIAPKAKTIIGLGFRVLRGSLRGIEEGTHFYQYPEMGIIHIDEVHAPETLRRISCYLEDRGFEGVVQRTVPDRRPGSDPGNNPEHLPVFKIKYAEPVAEGRPAPDVRMDFNQAAAICGMGEIGKGGFFLTPRFGPLQRFAFVLTDAEIEPDEAFSETLCDDCGKCIAGCPVKALSAEGQLDEWQCTAGRMGADVASNPFIHPEEVVGSPERFDEESVNKYLPVWDEAYPQVRFKYNPSMCGVACQRACLVHLEEKGVLQDKFVNKFRDKELWSLEK